MMMKDKIGGVYRIRNIINNKIYIGSSVSIYKRLASHKSDLKRNCHHSHHLQRSYIKYGAANFKIKIIETLTRVESESTQSYKDRLLKAEQEWINFYKSYKREFGYNISPTANSCLGVKHTLKTKFKLSDIGKKRYREDPKCKQKIKKWADTNRGRKRTEKECLNISAGLKKHYNNPWEHQRIIEHLKSPKVKTARDAYTNDRERVASINDANHKPFYVFTIEGKFIEQFTTKIDCAEKYDLHITQVSNCLKKKKEYLTVKNMVFSYSKDIESRLKEIKELKQKSEKIRRIKIGKFGKLKFSSIEARNKQALAVGGKKFKVFTKKGDYVGSWVNQQECAKNLNVFSTNISACLQNKVKSTGGYTFQYA